MTMLLPMVIFAMIASITPGPVNLIATSAAASFGYQRTIPHILGASIGFSLILLLLGLGLSAGLSGFFADNPSAIHFLTATGSAFLIYTAYKIAFASVGVDGENLGAPPKFLSGLLCQWLNPKAWVVAVSGVAVFVPEGGLAIIYLVMAFFGSCFVSISVWALMGLSIQGLLKDPVISRSFNQTMGGLLAALVVYILL